jgi:hypothetical protein
MESENINGTEKIHIAVCKDSDGRHYTENAIVPDIIGYGNTEEEAILSFEEDLAAYAREYSSNYQLYISAPNRAGHLPAVKNIISTYEACGSISGIIEIHPPKAIGEDQEA